MKKFYTIILGAVFSLAAVSCLPEAQDNWTPGEAEDAFCYGVYFPVQEAAGYHIYSPTDAPKVVITVSRTNTSGAITVPVEASYSADGIFEATPIAFADGQAETTFTLSFPAAEQGKTYSASFVITDATYASKYSTNPVAFDFSAMRVEMLKFATEDGKGAAKVKFTVNNDFLGDFGFEEDFYEMDGSIEYYEVDGVRYGKVVVDNEGGVWSSGAEINFTWYPKVNYEYGDFVYQPIEVGVGKTGYELDGAEVGEDHPCAVLFSDYYHHYTDLKNNSLGTFLDFVSNYGQSYLLSYYDGHGGFHFNLVYDIEGTNYWYGFCEDSVLGIADDYVRVDYRLESESDYCYNGEIPIELGAGVDVKKILLTAAEGKLNSAQVESAFAGLKEGADNVIVIPTDDFVYDEDTKLNYGAYNLALEKTGVYTILLAGVDEAGKTQSTDYFTAEFVAVADEEANAVVVSLGIEDTSVRYAPTYSKMNSFGYWISAAEDITELHVSVIPAADLTASAAAKIKSNAKLAVSAEVLEQMKAAGGYATLATGLNALTEYALVIWATNGKLDDFFVDFYTTDGLPLVPYGKGDYLYTQFWSGTDSGLTISVDPNYKDTYVISDWGGGIDFRFTWDGADKVVVADQFTGYTHSSYGPVWVDEFADYAGTTEQGVSTYADGVFTFNVIYYVSAGYFGYGTETFTLTEAPAGIIAQQKTISVKAPNKGWNHQIPSFSFERQLFEPVKVTATASDNKVVTKSVKRSATISKAQNQIKF